MRAGELDRLVTLQTAIYSPDDLNQQVPTFVELAKVRASKSDVSDVERIAAQQAGSVHTTRFRIRWSQTVRGLKTGDRVLCEGRAYQLTGVKEIGRREGLELTADARGDLEPRT